MKAAPILFCLILQSGGFLATAPTSAPRVRVEGGVVEGSYFDARTSDAVFKGIPFADPFSGIGKPEHLKQMGPNIWSRRITGEDRLAYLVSDDRVNLLQARFHY